MEFKDIPCIIRPPPGERQDRAFFVGLINNIIINRLYYNEMVMKMNDLFSWALVPIMHGLKETTIIERLL